MADNQLERDMANSHVGNTALILASDKLRIAETDLLRVEQSSHVLNSGVEHDMKKIEQCIKKADRYIGKAKMQILEAKINIIAAKVNGLQAKVDNNEAISELEMVQVELNIDETDINFKNLNIKGVDIEAIKHKLSTTTKSFQDT